MQIQYNPLEREAEVDIMPYCRGNHIWVLSWGSLAEGFLADGFSLNKLDPNDFRRTHRYGQMETHAKIQRISEVISRIADQKKCTMVSVVVAWELMNPRLTGAIIGIRNQKEALEMIGSTKLHLGKIEKGEIDSALPKSA